MKAVNPRFRYHKLPHTSTSVVYDFKRNLTYTLPNLHYGYRISQSPRTFVCYLDIKNIREITIKYPELLV